MKIIGKKNLLRLSAAAAALAVSVLLSGSALAEAPVQPEEAVHEQLVQEETNASPHMNFENYTLYVGAGSGRDTIRLSVYSGGTSYESISWSSSDEAVASVDNRGNVHAYREGKVRITAMLLPNEERVYCEITVKREEENLRLSDAHILLTIRYNDKNPVQQLKVSGVADPSTVTWSSNDTFIARVSSSGMVMGYNEGRATITAVSASGQKATCLVTVEKEHMALSRNSVTLTIKDQDRNPSVKLDVTHVDPYLSIGWRSSNTGVATVDNVGRVTAISPGKTTITATTSYGETDSCVVTVKEEEMRIDGTTTLNKTWQVPEPTTRLTAAGMYDRSQPVVWSVDNTQVARISADGTLTALNVGRATVTATSRDGRRATVDINVTSSIGTVSLDLPVLKLRDIGSSQQLHALVDVADPSKEKVTWVSDNPSIATVDQDGNVRSVGDGTAKITATSAYGKSATCDVISGPKAVKKYEFQEKFPVIGSLV